MNCRFAHLIKKTKSVLFWKRFYGSANIYEKINKAKRKFEYA